MQLLFVNSMTFDLVESPIQFWISYVVCLRVVDFKNSTQLSATQMSGELSGWFCHSTF